jgi:hypothetical protein
MLPIKWPPCSKQKTDAYHTQHQTQKKQSKWVAIRKCHDDGKKQTRQDSNRWHKKDGAQKAERLFRNVPI